VSLFKKLVKTVRKGVKTGVHYVQTSGLSSAMPGGPMAWGIADAMLNAKMQPQLSEPGIGYGAPEPPCTGDDCPEHAAFANASGLSSSSPSLERRFIDVFVRRPKLREAAKKLGGVFRKYSTRRRGARMHKVTKRRRRTGTRRRATPRRRRRMTALQRRYFGKRRKR